MRTMTRGTSLTVILGAAALALAALDQGTLGSRPALAAPPPDQVVVVNTAAQAVPTTVAKLPAPAVVAEQTTEIGFAGVTIVGPFDVRNYGKIRVFYALQANGFVRCNPEIVATNGQVFQLDAAMVNTLNSFPETKVYDVPGPVFRLSCFQDASTPPMLHIAIYGL